MKIVNVDKLVYSKLKGVGNVVNQKQIEMLATDIVCCKECRYWGDENGFLRAKDGITFARCKVHNHATYDGNIGWCPTENDYCSLGERRDRK